MPQDVPGDGNEQVFRVSQAGKNTKIALLVLAVPSFGMFALACLGALRSFGMQSPLVTLIQLVMFGYMAWFCGAGAIKCIAFLSNPPVITISGGEVRQHGYSPGSAPLGSFVMKGRKLGARWISGSAGAPRMVIQAQFFENREELQRLLEEGES